MSKKRKRRREERINTKSSNNLGNNIPFGINPTQLMNLFGSNIDLNQIGNILSSMKTDGVDLNSFNLNQGNSQLGSMGFDFSPLQSIMNNLGLGSFNMTSNNSSVLGYEKNNSHTEKLDNIESESESYDEESKEDTRDEFLEEDENIQMLIAVKSIVDYKKAIFLDRVIEAYNEGLFK